MSFLAAVALSYALGDIVTLVDGPAIECKVKSVDDEKIVVVVEYGTLVFSTSRVLAIEYDLGTRVSSLAKDDYKGRYDLARWALEQDLRDEALGLLTECAGKKGIANDAYKLLARLHEEKGEFGKALHFYKAYLAAVPGDKAVRIKVKELSPKGAPEPGPVKVAAEGIEATVAWKFETWGNPAQVTVTTEKGTKMLMVSFAAGEKQDKVAVRADLGKMDVSKKKKVVLSVCNMSGKPTKLALAFITPDDFFESRTRTVKPGQWVDLEFDLTRKDFKCKANNWTFASPIKGRDKLSALELMFYSYRSQGLFYFNDIKFE